MTIVLCGCLNTINCFVVYLVKSTSSITLHKKCVIQVVLCGKYWRKIYHDNVGIATEVVSMHVHTDYLLSSNKGGSHM